MGFTYAGTTYRFAYEIKDHAVIPILLCGTHENFYEQLKKLGKNPMLSTWEDRLHFKR